MSRAVPSELAPSEQEKDTKHRSLDAHEHGQAQNTIDKTKDTDGSAVNRNIGEAIDAVKTGGWLPARVDDVVNPSSIGSETIGAETEGESVGEHGNK